MFKEDINRLLAMDDLWNKEGRVKPTALDYEGIVDGSFAMPPLRSAPQAAAGPSANGTSNGSASSAVPAANGPAANGDSAQLRDQRELSLKENLELFVDRPVKSISSSKSCD